MGVEEAWKFTAVPATPVAGTVAEQRTVQTCGVTMARPWASPAPMTPTKPGETTCTGVSCQVVVPSPNCPWVLRPHAQTVPSPFRM